MKLQFDEKKYDAKSVLASFITEDEKYGIVANKELTYEEAMQLLQSTTLHIMHTFLKQHKDSPELIEAMYDSYNIMASSILNNLIPDNEINKDLDARSILKAQNELIEKEADEKSGSTPKGD